MVHQLARQSLFAAAALLLSGLALRAGESPVPPPRPLAYPEDLRDFRARALKADGVFAPDIAFAVRLCPRCGKPYVMGNFPRLKRRPFDSLAAVHEVVAKTCLKPAPSATIYSARLGRLVPRACPACEMPENGGLPDKVLFCHVIPESGVDLQIEYEVQAGKLAARKFWRVPPGGKAEAVTLPDESETSFQQAYGQYFSLRAVWNELFARAEQEGNFTLEEPKVTYRQVAPGLWFIFRPRRVSALEFQEFSENQLQPDRAKGLFTRIDTPLKSGGALDTSAGTYCDWAAAYASALAAGSMECFVGYSIPELRKAAQAVLASRHLVLETGSGAQNSVGGTDAVRKGAFKIDINLDRLAEQAVLSGLSLHHACAYYLTMPAFEVEGAENLNRLLRELYPECDFEVEQGRWLILRDRNKQERKLDLLNLAVNLDPGDSYLFELFRNKILAWDKDHGGFGPKLPDRDVSPSGLPAFIERRIRPAGHLKAHNLPEAFYEPREDRDGKSYDLCYTSECSATVVYVDPTRERFKGLTLDEVHRLYEAMSGILPLYIETQDTMSLPGDPAARARPCQAVLLCGLDLASLAAESARAFALAAAADFDLHPEDRLHFYAGTTNTVVLTQRQLTAEELKLVRARLKDLAAEADLEPGLELGLHFDLPPASPRGKVLRRHK